MSGFFGIFRPQGGPVDLEAFEQMKTAMHREGFDGMETHVEDKIAMGHLMLRVSPESKYDKQPLKSSCGNYLLVGHFRLDYRDELGDKLGLTQAELEVTPDSQLAMLAYQKWKEKCVYHLEGDWAAVFYLINLNSLVLLKDTIGYSALYYKNHNDCTCFSSDIDLFSKSKMFQLRPSIQQLLQISRPGFSLDEGLTLYEDLMCLKNSEQIFVSSKGKIISQFENKINLSKRVLCFKFEQDYFLEYISLFASAIKTRINYVRANGLFLSGGLDSTAILYFMSNETLVGSGEIVSFTSVPNLDYLEDQKKVNALQEFDLIQELSEIIKNCNYNYLSFPNSSLFDDLSSIRLKNGLNPLITPNTFWIEGILKELNKNNVKRVFNGQLGNYTLTWNSPLLNLSLFLNFKFIDLIRNLICFSKRNKISFLAASKIEVLSPMYSYIKNIFSSYLGRNRAFLNDTSIFQNHIGGKYKSKIGNLNVGFTPGVTFFNGPEQMRISIFNTLIKNIGMQWFQESHRQALESVDPSSDRRFVEFSFELPSKMFFFQGLRKYIYKNVMNGLLPDSIINSNKTFKQSIDIRKRIILDSGIKLIIKEIKDQEYLKNIFKIDDILSDYEILKDSNSHDIGSVFTNNFLKKLSIVRFYQLNSLNCHNK